MTTKTMDTTAIKRELMSQERAYWQAVKDRDADTMIRLTDDPCIVAGASGFTKVNQQMLKQIIGSANYTLDRFKIDEDGAEVVPLDNDTFLVAYKVHEELTVDGKAVSMDAADASVWRRRGDRWVCSMHTESLLGDSYGRDRKPMT